MITKDRFEKEIQSIVDQIIRLYKPEKIILFGSLAKGEINDATDIDLFIIKKDIPNIGVDRIRQIEALIRYNLATDYIIYRPEEVEDRLNQGDPFIKNIISKGKVLYNAN